MLDLKFESSSGHYFNNQDNIGSTFGIVICCTFGNNKTLLGGLFKQLQITVIKNAFIV